MVLEENWKTGGELEVKTFFFGEHCDFGEKIGESRDELEVKTFIFREHCDFGKKLRNRTPFFSDDFAFIY